MEIESLLLFGGLYIVEKEWWDTSFCTENEEINSASLDTCFGVVFIFLFCIFCYL